MGASSTASPKVTLACEGITKAYGKARVLDRVGLALAAGEVHALLGENGAGKSTLIRILSGATRPDEGTIHIGGQEVVLDDPRAATELGVATVFQEVTATPGLSVAENVLLGQMTPSRLGVVRRRALRDRAEALFRELGFEVDVRKPIEDVSPIAKTMTALARALSLDARVLILDEPTATLTDAETRRLFATIERLRRREVAVLYVSHRLHEVFEIAQRWTVLRNGMVVGSGSIDEVTPDDVIELMAGRPLDTVFPARSSGMGSQLLVGRGLTGRRIREFNLDVLSGEIVGISGLAGSGRSEVLRLLIGAQARSAGTVAVGDTRLKGKVRESLREGVVLVPQERRADALLPDTIERNLEITQLKQLSRRGVVNRGAARRHVLDVCRRFRVRCSSPQQDVLTLSGGNQQKVVLARYLSSRPRVVLLDEPTRGVDVGTKSEVYRMLRDAAANGAAVVVVSSEIPELLGLCDRVVALHEGVLVRSFDCENATEAEVLAACYGRGK